MHITCIDLFDHNVGMACAKVRLRCPCISLVLIYLITMWVWCVPKLDSDDHAYCLYNIDLFDHNVGMVCAKVRFRCSCISLVLIYLITMRVWHVPKLDLDVHSYHWYWFIWSKWEFDLTAFLKLDLDVHSYHWYWFIWLKWEFDLTAFLNF